MSTKKYLPYRIIPASRTWMRYFANIFVMEEDTWEMRMLLRQCHKEEYTGFTTFKCRHEPTYVLSRQCTDGYYHAPGICCKTDEIFNFLVETKLYSRLKYVLHCDDDMFWRPDQFLRWLAILDKTEVANLPLVGNVEQNYYGSDDNGGVWHIKNCKEIHSMGWYQPMLLNKMALDLITVGTKEYGITKTCKEFIVSQDVGIGPFLWMFQLYHVMIPGIGLNEGHEGEKYILGKQDTLLAVHYVKYEERDGCKDEAKWPLKY